MPPDAEFADVSRQLAAACARAMRVFGVRRSGQHAIIDWILRNCGTDDRIFLNNRLIGQSPLRSGKPAAKKADSTQNARYLARSISHKLTQGLRPFLLISYEKGFPAGLYNDGGLTPGFGNSDFSAEILVTRSFVNWLPSFMRLVVAEHPDRPATGVDNCQHILAEITRYKAHLLAAVAGKHTVVSYDVWVTQPAYRRTVLARLGLPVRDNGLGAVQPFGGGSSFSGMDIPAPEMATTRRWRTMKNDPFSRQFLALAHQDTDLQTALAALYPADKKVIQSLLART